MALSIEKAIKAADVAAGKKRRSFRVVPYTEVRAEIIERVGIKLWPSIVKVIEEAFEKSSKRPDVQRRAWFMIADLFKLYGHPNLWGRPFQLTRYSKAFKYRWGWGTGMIRTLIAWLSSLGLIEVFSEPLKWKGEGWAYECYTYVFGNTLRAAQQKIFRYVQRHTKSPVYKGLFLLSPKKSLENYLKRKKTSSIQTGDLAHDDEPRVCSMSEPQIRAMLGKPEPEPPKDAPQPKLDTIKDGRLQAALAGLAGLFARASKPVAPLEKPQPGFVPLTPMPVATIVTTAISSIGSTASAMLGFGERDDSELAAKRYPVATRAQREPRRKQQWAVPSYAPFGLDEDVVPTIEEPPNDEDHRRFQDGIDRRRERED